MADPRLTGAQLQSLRERLGLSRDWLATRLDCAEFSLKRWERGDRAVPDDVAIEILQLKEWHDEEVARGIRENQPVLSVRRTDKEDGGPWPAAWDRSVAVDIAAQTGALIDWAE